MMMGGDGEGIAIPYIKKGLDAWWDGEWNIGLDNHDSSSRIWKNLVSSNNMTLNGSANFGEKSLIIPSMGINVYASMDRIDYPDNNVTLEVVFKAYTNNAQSIFCFDKYGNGFMGIASRNSNRLVFRQYGPDVTHVFTQPIYCAYNYANDYIYINGEKVASTGSGGSYGAIAHYGTSFYGGNNYYFSGEIFCVRLYKRVLSSAEIHKNYLIDKERFQL